MRKNKRIDVQALIFAVPFTIFVGVVLAKWYHIQLNVIAKFGFFGFPMFLAMCALGAGVPSTWAFGLSDCGKIAEHSDSQGHEHPAVGPLRVVGRPRARSAYAA